MAYTEEILSGNGVTVIGRTLNRNTKNEIHKTYDGFEYTVFKCENSDVNPYHYRGCLVIVYDGVALTNGQGIHYDRGEPFKRIKDLNDCCNEFHKRYVRLDMNPIKVSDYVKQIKGTSERKQFISFLSNQYPQEYYNDLDKFVKFMEKFEMGLGDIEGYFTPEKDELVETFNDLRELVIYNLIIGIGYSVAEKLDKLDHFDNTTLFINVDYHYDENEGRLRISNCLVLDLKQFELCLKPIIRKLF